MANKQVSFFKRKAETKSVPAVATMSEKTRNGIDKAYIPKFLYKPPFGYPRFVDLPTIRRLAAVPYVEMCISTIIDEVCSVPWDILPIEDKETAATEEHIKQVQDFFDNPNTNKEGFEEIRRKYIRDVLEIDAGVINKIFNRAGQMVEIVARDGATFTKNPNIFGMMTDRDDIIKENNIAMNNREAQLMEPGWINAADVREKAAYFQYGWITGARPVPFGRKELVWLERNPRSDSIYGRSPVEILADTIQTLIYSIEHNLSYFNDNSIPKGILGLEGSNAEDLNAFKEQWEQQQMVQDSAGNWKKRFHNMPITGTMPKFERLEFTNAELELLEGQKWWAKLVWASFGVTSVELGYTEDSKGLANQIVQSNIFRKRTILPILRLEEYRINHEILSEFEFDDIEFKFSTFDVDEEMKKAQLYQAQLTAGWRSINEVRVQEGLEEVDWGEKKLEEYDAFGNPVGSGTESPGEMGGSEGQDQDEKKKIKIDKERMSEGKSFELKYKYVKRTGSPGHYTYWYKNPKTGKLQAGQKPKPNKSDNVKEKLRGMVRDSDTFEKFLESFNDSDKFKPKELDFISEKVPIDSIKQSQFGEDYLNSMSEGYARGDIIENRYEMNERPINVGKLTNAEQLPAIIVDTENKVIDGNHRLAAAKIAGLKEIKVVKEQKLKEFYESNKERLEQKAELKYKYVKRTGAPGHYIYWYKNPKTGKLQAGEKPKESKPKKVSSFDDAYNEFKEMDKFYDKVWADRDSEKLTRDEVNEEIKKLNDKYEGRRQELTKIMLDSRETPKKELIPKFTEYGIVSEVYSGSSKNGHIVEMSPDDFLKYAPEKANGIYVFNIAALKRVKDYVNNTGNLSVGYLDVEDGKITGHEGRHTAAVARIFGVKKINVLIAGPDHESFNENTKKQYKGFEDNPLILGENEEMNEDKLIKSITYILRKNEKEIKDLIEKEAGKNTLTEIKSVDGIAKAIKNILGFAGLKAISDKVIENTYLSGWDKAEQQLGRNFVVNKAVVDYIKDYTFNNIKDMTDTIVKSLRQELERGIMEGEGIAKIKARVTKVFDVGEVRASAIARTEVCRSENQGQLQAYKSSDETLTKTWLAAKDERTSEVCQRLDGQTVPLNDNFVDKKSGWEGPCPPAHCNCRSTVLYNSIDQ